MQSTPVDRPRCRANWRRLVLLILLCAVLVWNLRLGASPLGLIPSVNHNRLLIGDRADIRRPYDVRLNRPVELDFLTRGEVLQLRHDAVAQHPGVIHQGYRPSRAIFARVNVSKDDLPCEAVRILHFIHRGGSCGYPGGCNNGSPYQPELDNFRVEALPAHLDVLLWRNRPKDISESPVMRFAVRFE